VRLFFCICSQLQMQIKRICLYSDVRLNLSRYGKYTSIIVLFSLSVSIDINKQIKTQNPVIVKTSYNPQG